MSTRMLRWFSIVALCATTLLPLARPARAEFEAMTQGRMLNSVGSVYEFFGGGSSPHNLTDGSLDNGFSWGGALCPAPGSPDFMCAKTYARAALITSPGPAWSGISAYGVVSLSALARFEVSTSTASLIDVRGEARVYLLMGCGTDNGRIRLNLNIAGTESTFSSADAAEVTVSTDKILNPCRDSGPCVTSSCNSTRPTGTLFRVNAIARLKNNTFPFRTGFSATAVSDYAHTLIVDGADVVDANEQVIPGARVYITDNDGVLVTSLLTAGEAALLPQSAALSVHAIGSGTGTIHSTQADPQDVQGLDCGAVCTRRFLKSDTVTLHATPSPGSSFSGWSGACTGTGDCMLGMSVDRDATATFTLQPHTAADDSFLCWQARAAKAPKGSAPFPRFLPLPSRVVVDALASGIPEDQHRLDILKVTRFCNPAALSGDSAATLLDPGHLEAYQAKLTRTNPRQPKSGTRRLPLTDRFGAIVLDVKAADSVLVPAGAVLGTGGAPALADGTLDALRCYPAKLAKAKRGEPALPTFVAPKMVAVQDGVTTQLFDVTKPKRVCLPADLDGTHPAAPASSLLRVCYAVKPSKTKPAQAKVVGATFSTSPTFGPEVLALKKPTELCVPASR